jgi:hypothetical protein
VINEIMAELRVRGMGEEMISAIGVHATEIADRMQNAVRKAIADFNFDAFIEAKANKALEDYVNSPEGKAQVDKIFKEAIRLRLMQYIRTLELQKV